MRLEELRSNIATRYDEVSGREISETERLYKSAMGIPTEPLGRPTADIPF
ncbi:MAG: hypothetical protein AABW71_04825 [Nanoarchaeota archaeon]